MSERARLDAMRLKAFKTNKEEDKKEFYEELSRLFQNYKLVTVEEAARCGAKGFPFDWKEGHGRCTRLP